MPIEKKMPVVHSSASAFSTAGVFFGHGPSSKVSTTSLSRRKSSSLKCSKPKPGPPVVSISTVRATPSAPGVLQAARAGCGACFGGGGKAGCAGAAAAAAGAAGAGAGTAAGAAWVAAAGFAAGVCDQAAPVNATDIALAKISPAATRMVLSSRLIPLFCRGFSLPAKPSCPKQS
ncbi:hypothetical protein ACVW04_005015 [Bradyrhizobium sp. LM2.3]